jgi:cytochrome b
MHAPYGKIEGEMVAVTDTVVLVVLAVASAIHIAGITILGVMLRESLRLTRAVGALVIQEEEKTRRLFQR